METDQAAVIQGIVQAAVEATKVAVKAMATPAGESSSQVINEQRNMGPKLGRPH